MILVITSSLLSIDFAFIRLPFFSLFFKHRLGLFVFSVNLATALFFPSCHFRVMHLLQSILCVLLMSPTQKRLSF